MTTEFQNLISSLSIEELSDEEVVNLMSKIKNFIPEFECAKNSELEILSLEDKELQAPQKKEKF